MFEFEESLNIHLPTAEVPVPTSPTTTTDFEKGATFSKFCLHDAKININMYAKCHKYVHMFEFSLGDGKQDELGKLFYARNFVM